MKKIKPMKLEAKYFPPGPTDGFDELDEDIRRQPNIEEKRELRNFIFKNILAVATVLWLSFYLFNFTNEQSVAFDLLKYFPIISILLSFGYAIFGIPLLSVQKLQKIKNRCRICGTKLDIHQTGTGSISETKYVCEFCKKFTTDTHYSVTMGSE